MISQPFNISEYEHFAREKLSKSAFDYYSSGSNDMVTLRENRAAFTRLRLLPKILVDVSNINLKTTILGEQLDFPICLAPSAMQCMAHSDGEIATSIAANRLNTLMTLSSLSTKSLEDVANAAPNGLRWFQLYIYKDKNTTLNLIRRAERSGYKAIAVTVDTPILGRREADLKNKFSLPSHLTLGNFQVEHGKSRGLSVDDVSHNNISPSSLVSYFASLIDSSLNWDDIAWLRRNTTLKIVVKGVMTVDDALISIRNGVDAIWISNHGARQLDTTPATIEVLPEIARAVAGRVELYIDGGISRGTDALKAIALGARAVFIGRPVLWGLAHSGEEGVYNVVNLLKEEFALAMALSGCVKVEDIKPSLVRTALSFQSKL